MTESHADDVLVPEALRPLIPRFQQRTAAELARLQAALAAGDWRSIEQMAHKLKGSAGSYGFHHLGNLAGRLETAAKAAEPSVATALVAALHEHFAKASVRYV